MLSFQLTDDDRRALLRIARSAIVSEVRGEPLLTTAAGELSDNLKVTTGVFVTIHQASELRGCIGHIRSNVPLCEATDEVARSAAVRDPRFPRLSIAELDTIQLEVSVLSPFVPVLDPESVVAGRDGLIVQRGFHSGLLLPQVATEHGWSRDELLGWTCRKAGLPLDAWRDRTTTIQKFTADVFDEKLLLSQ